MTKIKRTKGSQLFSLWLHLTSQRPCWQKEQQGTLTLLLCKTWATFFYCFAPKWPSYHVSAMKEHKAGQYDFEFHLTRHIPINSDSKPAHAQNEKLIFSVKSECCLQCRYTTTYKGEKCFYICFHCRTSFFMLLCVVPSMSAFVLLSKLRKPRAVSHRRVESTFVWVPL